MASVSRKTNWAAAEQRKDVVTAGRAAEFWTRYPEDFARCRALGLSAFRLGIEWSRVQPVHRNQAGPAPEFDYTALDHYAAMFAECRRNGIEPVVTLHHFVHPAWLGPDPWLEPVIVELFGTYVRAAVGYLNEKLAGAFSEPPLKWFITINEPNMLALNTYLGHQFPSRARGGFAAMTRCYTHLLTAHVRAYNALHDLYESRGWPAPMVTLNNYCSDLYWSDKFLLDLLALRERGVPRTGVREHVFAMATELATEFERARIPLHKELPYYFGALVKRLSNWIGHRTFQPEHFALLLDAIYASPRERLLDYIGLDYYDPFAAHAFRLPVWWDHEFKNRSLRSWMLNTVTSKWWDWRVLPRGLHFFCSYYSRAFGGRSVLIAENGMALRRRVDNQRTHRRDRMTRSQFLRLHVHEVGRIVAEGIPLIGYLHWSLVDNYEWGTFTPRFGLFSIDYERGTDRLEEDHFHDRPSKTYARLIREWRESQVRP